jgi:hypothetical protein
MSKFADAVNKCIKDLGKGILKDARLMNILADYHAYDDKPATKYVISAILSGGYTDHLLDKSYSQAQILKDITEISDLYGLKTELVREVYEVVLGSTQIKLPEEQKSIERTLENVKVLHAKCMRYKAICESYKYDKNLESKYTKDEFGVLYSSDGKAMVSWGDFNGSSYSIKYGTIYIANWVEYNGKNDWKCTKLTIPPTIKAIGNYAFSSKDLVHLELPSTVEFIGEGAFSDNSELSGDIIKEGVRYIEEYAFNDTGLTSVILPSTLCYVGGAAFPLGSVSKNFSDHLVYENGVLYDKNKTVLLSLFSNLDRLVLPDTVREIGSSAIGDCDNLREIVLSRSLEKIDSYAFPENIEKVVFGSRLKEIGEAAFYGCEHIESLELPNSLEIIGEGAFENCTNLCEINIPKKVKQIGNNAFANCGMLSKINCDSPNFEIHNNTLYEREKKRLITYFGTYPKCVVRNGTKVIDRDAFANNLILKEIVLPSSLESVSTLAFGGCQNLKKICAKNPKCFDSLKIILPDRGIEVSNSESS